MTKELQAIMDKNNVSSRMISQYIFEEEQEHRDNCGELDLTMLAQDVEQHFNLYGEDESNFVDGLFDHVTHLCFVLELI